MSSVAEERVARSVALEKAYVHDVYEQFSDGPRGRPWPKVNQFLADLEPGSIVCDVGCGNGKYLGSNPSVFNIGADKCIRLTKVAREKENEVLICDNLALPFRDESFDAVLSVAVVHHFATTERRVCALRELARILRIGGRLIISVWAMEQTHRKFESQDVLVPWHRPQTLSTPSLELTSTTNTSEEDVLPPYHAYTQTSDSDSNKSIRAKAGLRKRGRTRHKGRSIDPGRSSSPSSSSLSSPNETCYSFVRRAIQKLAGGKRSGTSSRPWFLDTWNSCTKEPPQKRYDPDGCENYDCGNVQDLPIELRRVDDDEPPQRRQTFPSSQISIGSDLYGGIKSKSLTDIKTFDDRLMVRSQSSVPSLQQEISLEDETPAPIEIKIVASTRSLNKNKPKLVKQKQSICDEDAEEALDKPTDMRNLVNALPDFRVYHGNSRHRGSVFKQRSMNEELMSTERLREKERVKRNIQKQASLNEELIYHRHTLDSLKDSFFSVSTSKRFQLIKSGFTNTIKNSTTNIEKVAGSSLKNGFVRMFQGWKGNELVVSPTQPPTDAVEQTTTNNLVKPVVANSEEKKDAASGGSGSGGERRHSREDGSDSSKDSSLQSDTSVDSEDSFASVIFVPKTDPLSPAPLSPGPTSPRLKQTSVPNSPRIKQSSCPTSPRIKQMPLTVYPLTKQLSSPKPSSNTTSKPAISTPIVAGKASESSGKLSSCRDQLEKDEPKIAESIISDAKTNSENSKVEPDLNFLGFKMPPEPFQSPDSNGKPSRPDGKTDGSPDGSPRGSSEGSLDGSQGGNPPEKLSKVEGNPEGKPSKTGSISEGNPEGKLGGNPQGKSDENPSKTGGNPEGKLGGNPARKPSKAGGNPAGNPSKADGSPEGKPSKPGGNPKGQLGGKSEKTSSIKDETLAQKYSVAMIPKFHKKPTVTESLAKNLTEIEIEQKLEDRKRTERLRQIRELLNQRPGFGIRSSRSAFPIVRHTSVRSGGRIEAIARPLPRLLSLELFNPETDDKDSDSSGVSSPDSVDSVINIEVSENNQGSKLDNDIPEDKKPSSTKFTFPPVGDASSTASTPETLSKPEEPKPKLSPTSMSLLEAAADVANSLDEAVDAVIQSSPRAKRRQVPVESKEVMSVMERQYSSEESKRLSPNCSEAQGAEKLAGSGWSTKYSSEDSRRLSPDCSEAQVAGKLEGSGWSTIRECNTSAEMVIEGGNRRTATKGPGKLEESGGRKTTTKDPAKSENNAEPSRSSKCTDPWSIKVSTKSESVWSVGPPSAGRVVESYSRRTTKDLGKSEESGNRKTAKDSAKSECNAEPSRVVESGSKRTTKDPGKLEESGDRRTAKDSTMMFECNAESGRPSKCIDPWSIKTSTELEGVWSVGSTESRKEAWCVRPLGECSGGESAWISRPSERNSSVGESAWSSNGAPTVDSWSLRPSDRNGPLIESTWSARSTDCNNAPTTLSTWSTIPPAVCSFESVWSAERKEPWSIRPTVTDCNGERNCALKESAWIPRSSGENPEAAWFLRPPERGNGNSGSEQVKKLGGCEGTQIESTWDEECHRHLSDFADKLSEKLLLEIDQYQEQSRRQEQKEVKFSVSSAFQHIDDPYIHRLSEELKDLNKLSAEIQKQNQYLSQLSKADAETAKTKQQQQQCKCSSERIYSDSDRLLKSDKVPSYYVKNSDKDVAETKSDLNCVVDQGCFKGSLINRLVSSGSGSGSGSEHTDGAMTTTPLDLEASVPLVRNIAATAVTAVTGCHRLSRESSDAQRSIDSTDTADISEMTTASCGSDSQKDTNNSWQQCSGKQSDESSLNEAMLSGVAEGPMGDMMVGMAGGSLNASLSDTSQDSLPSDNIGGAITYHRYYHVFREGELDQLIERYVENLHIISSYYDHASWCVVAEKVQVWTI